ncbi:MAG: S8 family serine peptidase [Planctomycetota bacterium]|nr:S8 family serine peptidase [Planctomycetota bacterium]
MTASRHSVLRVPLVLLALAVVAVGAPSADACWLTDWFTEGSCHTPEKGGIDPTTVPIIDEDLLFSVNPAVVMIRANRVRDVATGTGVVVAVLDGGFDCDHPAIAANVLPLGYDAVDDDNDPNDGGDWWDNDWDGVRDRAVGHGTFVAGQVLAAAPDAMILPVRVRDDEGWGTDAETRAGMRYALEMGVDILNFSGSFADDEPENVALLQELHAAGILVVMSAGNDGLDEIANIFFERTAVAVCAMDAERTLTPWTNFQSTTEAAVLCAPGQDLIGPYGADSYAIWSGTSFATGLVSGGAAVVLEAQPMFGPSDIFHKLRDTGRKVFSRDGNRLPIGRSPHLYRAVTQ